MRVAALYDIHGNLPALEAVLDEVRKAGVNHVVVGGDVVPGPMPCETIGLLRDLDLPVQFIQGNGDREVVGWRRGQESDVIPESYRETMRWVARQLHPDEETLLAGWPETVQVHVDGLGGALRDGRADDMRRGLSLVGPHRDEVELRIEGRLSRSHASQGEQRTLALALRLGGHRLLSGRLGSPPVLLLDDVFSELDPVRSDALIRHLPPGQALLATAGEVPPSAAVEETIRVVRIDGRSRLFTGPGMAVDKAGETVEETASERVG